MSDGFLTGRLVTSKRFRPGDEEQKPAAEVADVSASDLVAEESVQLRNQSYAELWQELQRRRREILRELEETTGELTRRKEAIEDTLSLFREKRKFLDDGPSDGPDTPNPAELQRLRQELHELNLELTICRNRHVGTEIGKAGMSFEDVSFSELTKIGFALSLPITVSIVVAGIIIGVFVAAVFGI